MRKGYTIAALGLAITMSVGLFQTSGASGIVSAETSIAGASLALEQYNVDTEIQDAVLALLFGSEEETEEEETETSAPTATLYAVANSGNYVRVRSVPSTEDDSTIVGKMYDGAVAIIQDSVEGEDGTWYLISSGSVEGYVKADFFIVGTEEDSAIASYFNLIGTVSSTTAGLYVRSGPSVETEAITMLGAGTQMVILGEEGDFYYIQIDATCVGYVHKDYVDVTKTYTQAISLSEERLLAEQEYESQHVADSTQTEVVAEEPVTEVETAAPVTETETAAATTETVSEVTLVGVQASYNGGTKYVGDTVSGAELTVRGVYSDGSTYAVDGWGCAQVGVALSEGTNTFVVVYNGYETSFTVEAVANTTTTTDTNSELRSAIVNYAMQFLGNPYVYGGTDLVNGADCSGFTMGVYAYFGIDITRTSRSQAAAGTEISLSDVQLGDLVFYTDVSTGVIGHVGIYIGDGKIIHAASEALGICISDMYYRQPYKAVTFLN